MEEARCAGHGGNHRIVMRTCESLILRLQRPDFGAMPHTKLREWLMSQPRQQSYCDHILAHCCSAAFHLSTHSVNGFSSEASGGSPSQPSFTSVTALLSVATHTSSCAVAPVSLSS